MSTSTQNPNANSKPVRAGIPGVKNIIAVSSGKGGVGKSTVSTNLALALQQQGFAVGLLDTDVYGPNIPTMMGVHETPQARQEEGRGEVLVPVMAHGVKLMSMGFLIKGDQPVVWRGPMLHSIVAQFIQKVDWGTLDFLVVDMPPGTGDVQLSLTQMVALAGAVLVTTPQEVAAQDVRKALLMFEKVGVPILGIVENMSYFIAPDTGTRYDIFGSGAGEALAEKYKTTLLAKIPLHSAIREAGDAGMPASLRLKDSAEGQQWAELAKRVVAEVQKGEVRVNAFQEMKIESNW